jgi:predicted MFS family arabinose efflux permease
MAELRALFTREFLALNGIVFLAFCNIAVFFKFHEYLGTLPIGKDWFGLLIALFSLSVLVIRPFISPFFHPDNARRWIGIGCVAVIASLMLYNQCRDFWSMALLRVVHGAGYVVMVTAIVSRMVDCIPPGMSGQAFGLFSVITLLPYAVLPPLMEPLTRRLGSFDGVLEACAIAMVLTFPLLRMVGSQPKDLAKGPESRINIKELGENLRNPPVVAILVLSLLVWASFTPVFYFLNGFGDRIGVTNAGWFFTLSTMTEIGVRVFAGHLFDRLDKRKLLLGSVAWLCLGCAAMAHLSGPVSFYGMGLVLGLGWGVVMPMLSALLFDVSEPRLRPLNTNLAMEMFQAGWFVGPVVGAPVLAHWGYPTLYYACSGMLLAGLALAPLLSVKREGEMTFGHN